MANSLPTSKYHALRQAADQLASCTDQIFQQIEQEQILDGIIERIRACLELDDLFQETSRSIRQLLNADRVSVFRFYPESGWNEGEFVSEDVVAGFPSAYAQKVHDHCFGSQFAVYYAQGRVQAVADIYNANLSDCHISILERFQVRANMIVPVLKGEDLWGLLCVHQCSQPRRWQQAEIGFVQKIANHFAIALQQSEHLAKLREQATLVAQNQAQEVSLVRQKSLFKIVNKIRQSLSFNNICDTATHEVRQILKADRVAIYRFNPDFSGNFIVESVGENWRSLVGTFPTIYDSYLIETQGGRYADNQIFAISDIYNAGHSDCHIQLLEQFQAKAYAIAPIFQDDYLWGLLAVYQNTAPRQWQSDEVELLAVMGEQLGIALQQANEQHKAIQRQKSLVKMVSKIRQSLDFDEICHTTTAEVRKLLEVNRVAIYRFNDDWSGDFVFESVDEEWQPLVGVLPTIEDAYLTTTKGGRYAAGETFAVPDIYATDHVPCHLELLKDFQARAYAIAPIFQDDCLWGLLVAFQNSMTRYWQPDEVDLLAQVGEQLGVALKQADFVAKIQAQSEALRESQVQLVQQEKMAGLGQLVAGVAHEINNPVNFIYGNLPHINDYVTDLLAIAELCQDTSLTPSEDFHKLHDIAKDLDLDFIVTDLPKILASMKIGTERIRNIVISLRNFSRLDEADFKAVDIHEGIDSTLLILSNRLKFKVTGQDIQVIKQYGDIPLVECFPAQLNQVFMNLLANAIDALEEAIARNIYDHGETPTIWLKTARHDDQNITVTVRDNGIGFEHIDTSKIFNHFFISKPIGKGTGIGLSIAHKIVTQKHGGSLKFNALENGLTEFVMQLPIRATPAVNEQHRQERCDKPQLVSV